MKGGKSSKLCNFRYWEIFGNNGYLGCLDNWIQSLLYEVISEIDIFEEQIQGEIILYSFSTSLVPKQDT